MKKIIIHVGPGKCGSSSIQDHLFSEDSGYSAKTRMIDPQIISHLNEDDPASQPSAEVLGLIETALERDEELILSHEFFFSKLNAIKKVAQLSRQLAEDVRVVGYSRRQSSFLKSAYSQWHFRSPDHTHEMCAILEAHGLEPALFSGLERFFIATIISDRYAAASSVDKHILHWGPRYSRLADALADTGARLSVGFIPSRTHPFSLIEDFNNRADLKPSGLEAGSNEITNRQFHPDLIEAVNLGVVNGLSMPAPHEDNHFLHGTHLPPHPSASDEVQLMAVLEAYIDTLFHEENLAFCEQFKLGHSYFTPARAADRVAAERIIQETYAHRRDNPGVMAERNGRLAAVLIQHLFETYSQTLAAQT